MTTCVCTRVGIAAHEHVAAAVARPVASEVDGRDGSRQPEADERETLREHGGAGGLGGGECSVADDAGWRLRCK